MTHFIRAIASPLAITIAAASLALCCASAVRAADDAVVRVLIGHAGPTSGGMSRMGLDSENGARLAIEDLNAQAPRIGGHPVRFELQAEDDGGRVDPAQRAAYRLVQAHAVAVVGHLQSSATMMTSPIYHDAGVPQLTPSAMFPGFTTQGFDTTYRLIADDVRVARLLARHSAERLHARRVAILDDGTRYGLGGGAAFQDESVALGATVVRHDSGRATLADFVAAVRESRPDAVFVAGMDELAGPLVQRLREAGVTVPVLGGDGICTNDLPQLAGGSSMNDVFCAESGAADPAGREATRAFRARFEARFGTPVQFYAPQAYDATMVVGRAIIAADSVDPAVWRPVLARTRGFEGASGTVSFDAHGENVDAPAALYAWADGHRVRVATLR